jgi:3'-5' exonuclease
MSESLFGDTPLTLVESQKELLEMVAALREEPVIGVDTESDGFHRFREKVTLIQISGPDQDWIIDRMTLNDLSPLAELLENPAQVKIFHGADYDVVSLRRDFGFLIQNLFDTMVASQFLGLPEIGLAGLIKRYFGHHIDKQYQRYDWSLRPLLPEHLSYARCARCWCRSCRGSGGWIGWRRSARCSVSGNGRGGRAIPPTSSASRVRAICPSTGFGCCGRSGATERSRPSAWIARCSR